MLSFSNSTTRLLDKMTNSERKALSMFASSQYAATAKIPLLLSFLLKMLYKNKASANIDKATLLRKWFEETYPNEVFEPEKEEKNFNALLSKLNDLILDFFAVNRIQTSSFLKQRYLLEELRKRDLLDFIKPETYQNINEAKESTANYITHWETQDHLDRYYEAITERSTDAKNNIEQATQALDAAFFVNKLRYICVAHDHSQVFASKEAANSVSNSFVLQWLAANAELTQNYPLLNTYYLLWQMLTNTQDIHFFEAARQFVVAHEDQFDSLDLDTIYSLLTNYAVRRNNSGDKTFASIAAELYQNGLAKGYFHRNNASIIFIYKNVIKLWLQGGEVARATAFAENVKPDFGNETALYTYCIATIDFEKKDYTKVIDALKGLHFKDISNKIDNSMLLLRACFCTGDIDVFAVQLDSTRRALKRTSGKSEIAAHYLHYENFVEFLSEIAKHNQKVHFKSWSYNMVDNRVKLQNEIEQTDPVIYKKWLLAQIK